MNKKLLAALAVAGIAAAVANRDRVAQGLTWIRTKGEEGLAWVIAQVPLPFGLATDDPTPEGGELNPDLEEALETEPEQRYYGLGGPVRPEWKVTSEN